MKKIANIVLNNFTNDSRVLKTALSLAKNNYAVTVVAMHSDGLLERESVENIVIDRLRLKTHKWPNVRPIQLVKYLEFLLKAVFRYRKYTIIHCNDLAALPIGVIIKIINRDVKLIYDAHEYETETNGLGRLEKVCRKYLEKILIDCADEIICVSKSIALEYARLYGIDEPYLVLNCPPYRDAEKSDIFRESMGIRHNQTIFLYQGALGHGRGIETIIAAFEALDSDANILVCMGYGPLEKMIQERSVRSPNIFFHPAVKFDMLLNYTSSADYGISFIEDSCLSYRYCLPNKMFEYLMAGIPVLTSKLYEMERFVNAYHVGVVAKSNTVRGFCEAISCSLEQDYEAVVRNVVETRKQFCWEQQERVLLEAYSGIG